ncbi:hypothetical protein [Flammeovirga sp. EKP202]|uniref:hypothetical protein n=1 Tax=Flammeovirga sp. EKP202 TaxID=2770592 RepID=UPI00165FDB99|nr:hypothetical protein [Flammeovirga sp. EKP202]MBD0402026.1 hypothetical protein [Flammeovirga sp. EKP202]
MGKNINLSKYLTEEFETREGLDALLEFVVSSWNDIQSLEVDSSLENSETPNDQILSFLSSIDAQLDYGQGYRDFENSLLPSLQKISDRINKQYDVVLNPYFKKRSITSEQERNVDIRDLTNLIVLMESLLINYDLEEYDEEIEIYKKVFLDGKIDQKPFGVKNFLAKTVGKFLVLANNNVIAYEDKALAEKLVAYKKRLTADILFLIFNVSWLPKERTYKNTLILNLLQSMELGDNLDDYGDIMTQVLAYTQKVKNLNPSIVRECTVFHDYTLPKYLEWKQLEIRERTFKPLGEVEEFNILFAKKLGFFTVDTIQSNGNSDIVRAGYPIVNGHFVWENIPMGDKANKKVVYQ